MTRTPRNDDERQALKASAGHSAKAREKTFGARLNEAIYERPDDPVKSAAVYSVPAYDVPEDWD